MAGEISRERGTVSCHTNTSHFGNYLECSVLGSQLGLEDSRRLFNCWWNPMQVEEDEAVTENSEEEKVAGEAKSEVFTGPLLYFLICGMPY